MLPNINTWQTWEERKEGIRKKDDKRDSHHTKYRNIEKKKRAISGEWLKQSVRVQGEVTETLQNREIHGS